MIVQVSLVDFYCCLLWTEITILLKNADQGVPSFHWAQGEATTQMSN
jgi:hypothetical protein